MFEALNICGSAMTVHQTWLDAISDNIANVNTARRTSEQAFQTRYVVAQSMWLFRSWAWGVGVAEGAGCVASAVTPAAGIEIAPFEAEAMTLQALTNGARASHSPRVSPPQPLPRRF